MKCRRHLLPLFVLCTTLVLLGFRSVASARPIRTMATDDLLPRLPAGRTLDTMFAIDLDGRKRTEYVVVSHAEEGGYGDRTHIQVVVYDAHMHAFRVVLSTSTRRIDSLEVCDLTGDGHPEVIAMLDDDGNDEVVTMGMVIYSGHGGRIRTVFKSYHGHPQLTSLPAGGSVILYYEKLGPPYVAHVFSREYLCDIFAFRNNTFVSVKNGCSQMFLDEAKEYLDEYRSTIDSSDASDTARQDARDESSGSDLRIPDGLDVLIPVTLAMTSYRLAGARTSLDTFWNSERAFLQRRLSRAYFDYVTQVHAGRLQFQKVYLDPEIPKPGSRQHDVLP